MNIDRNYNINDCVQHAIILYSAKYLAYPEYSFYMNYINTLRITDITAIELHLVAEALDTDFIIPVNHKTNTSIVSMLCNLFLSITPFYKLKGITLIYLYFTLCLVYITIIITVILILLVQYRKTYIYYLDKIENYSNKLYTNYIKFIDYNELHICLYISNFIVELIFCLFL